jgi:hypothetical protein
MKSRLLVLALALCASPVILSADDRIDTLKKQIESLNRQLESVQTERSDSRSTRIGPTRSRPRESVLVLRLYDLSDLFAIAPSYPAEYPREFGQAARLVFPVAGEEGKPSSLAAMGGTGGSFGGGGGMGGGMFQVGDKDKGPTDVKVTVGELMNSIRQVIHPDAWGNDNDSQARVTALGTALLVSADDETHAEIRDLLGLFRKRWGTLRTISVQAWWLWLNDEQVHGLLVPESAKPADGVKAFGLVDQGAWTRLMGDLHSKSEHDSRRLGYRAALTCYNGQVVHVMSGGQRLAVTDVRPVVVPSENPSGAASVAMQPELSVINEGAVLQVRPIANVSGKTVVLDIHSRVNVRHDAQASDGGASDPPSKTSDRSKNKAPAIAVPVVDRNLQLLTSRLSTTLRIPVEQRMLVGGMTFEDQPVPGERSLYLFVKCSVQEIRNDLEEAAPGMQPKAANSVPATTDAGPARKPRTSEIP